MEVLKRSFDSMFERYSIVKLKTLPLAALSAEKGFKLNGEFCDENFVKVKEEFGKHSIPTLQFSKVIVCETTKESSKSERALPHSRKDAFVKIENRDLPMQMPLWQFLNKHSSIVTLLQLSTQNEFRQLTKAQFNIKRESGS
jgi:hypothetical protein